MDNNKFQNKNITKRNNTTKKYNNLVDLTRIRQQKQKQLQLRQDYELSLYYKPSFLSSLAPYLQVGAIILVLILCGIFMYKVFGVLTTENIYKILIK